MADAWGWGTCSFFFAALRHVPVRQVPRSLARHRQQTSRVNILRIQIQHIPSKLANNQPLIAIDGRIGSIKPLFNPLLYTLRSHNATHHKRTEVKTPREHTTYCDASSVPSPRRANVPAKIPIDGTRNAADVTIAADNDLATPIQPIIGPIDTCPTASP